MALRIALVATVYKHLSHAQHIGDRFLVGYPWKGRWHHPSARIVSLYVEQHPEGDQSADRGREHMPTYLLQWEAIRWAKEQGCEVYDFWGIPDPPEDANEAEVSPINARSGMRGVYWFKKGFGGREVEYPGAYDYVYNPLLYKLWMRWRGANLG